MTDRLRKEVAAVVAALPNCCQGHSGFTYIIAAGDRIKIGQSTAPTHRITDLQTACPLPIRVLFITRDADLEHQLHETCARFRTHGEWFETEALGCLSVLLARSRTFKVCLRCAFHWNKRDTEREFVRRHAIPRWIACDCGPCPMAWVRNDGLIDTGHRRMLSLFSNNCTLSAEAILAADDESGWYSLPAPSKSMGAWSAQCLVQRVAAGGEIDEYAARWLLEKTHGNWYDPDGRIAKVRLVARDIAYPSRRVA
jgi:hypothetical protein